jgi:SAM-dependent methyltransferase
MFCCAICEGNSARELLRIDSPDRFETSIGIKDAGYVRRWVECETCGTASNVLPPESAEHLATIRAAYYEVDFIGSDIGDKYLRVMSMPVGQSDNAGRVARVLNFVRRWFEVSADIRVMDIGAGTGVFLSRLVDETLGSWQYLGVEPDPRAAAHLRQLKKFPVVEAMYQGQSELCGFSLVTLNKVLEHIEHPLPFLEQITQSLLPHNGLLYIEVPDKVTIQLRSQNDNILGALHCHLYDPLSLGYLLRRAGLQLLRVDRIREPSQKLSLCAFAAPLQSIHNQGLPYE